MDIVHPVETSAHHIVDHRQITGDTSYAEGTGKPGWDLARERLQKDLTARIIAGRTSELNMPPHALADSIHLLNKPYTRQNVESIIYSR
jgi:hypothetical protein